MKLGEFCTLFVLFFRVKYFNFKEAVWVRRAFPGFTRYRLALRRAYRFHNPFSLCREHLAGLGKTSVDAYGETPLPVLARMAEEFSLKKEDHLLELGCGRGKGVFFLSHLTGCSAVGVDFVPFFITAATAIAKNTTPSLPVSFRCESMETADFSGATVIYLYGTCLAEEEIGALVHRFATLPPSTRIITVSYPLAEYSPRFQTRGQFTADFPWGQGEVFLNGL